jgi:NAD(P)-dependent dehydrogenase (short-subunit alcohol dehydrogenase family)
MEQLSFDDLNGKVVVITGGAGVICRSLAMGFGSLGMKTVIADLDETAARQVAEEISSQTGSFSIGVQANVLDKTSLATALEIIHQEAGQISYLVNGAGGNAASATTSVEWIEQAGMDNPEDTFFGLDIEGFRKAFDLNFMGTVLPTMIFSRDMIATGRGAILNISSLNAYRPLTKIPAYSAAKASINNFTEWLAVHFAKTGVRVNAISPGFILTRQNHFLLINETTGELTDRGRKIIKNTPMARFGVPEELNGVAAFLLSDMARFITGTTLLVDGGFNSYSGV